MNHGIDTISADTFAMLRDLLAVLADPKRSAETLAEVERRESLARKAEHRSQTVIDRHNVQIARDNAELDQRRDQLGAKSRELTSREAMVDAREKTLERAKVTHHDSTLFGGLTREEFVDGRRQDTG
jgi:hypothetical protein